MVYIVSERQIKCTPFPAELGAPFHCCSKRRFHYLRTDNKLGAAKSHKGQVGLLPLAPKQWNILEFKEEVLRQSQKAVWIPTWEQVALCFNFSCQQNRKHKTSPSLGTALASNLYWNVVVRSVMGSLLVAMETDRGACLVLWVLWAAYKKKKKKRTVSNPVLQIHIFFKND